MSSQNDSSTAKQSQPQPPTSYMAGPRHQQPPMAGHVAGGPGVHQMRFNQHSQQQPGPAGHMPRQSAPYRTHMVHAQQVPGVQPNVQTAGMPQMMAAIPPHYNAHAGNYAHQHAPSGQIILSAHHIQALQFHPAPQGYPAPIQHRPVFTGQPPQQQPLYGFPYGGFQYMAPTAQPGHQVVHGQQQAMHPTAQHGQQRLQHQGHGPQQIAQVDGSQSQPGQPQPQSQGGPHMAQGQPHGVVQQQQPPGGGVPPHKTHRGPPGQGQHGIVPMTHQQQGQPPIEQRPPSAHHPQNMQPTLLSSQLPEYKPREKKLALIQDPSGNTIDIKTLASEKTPVPSKESTPAPSEPRAKTEPAQSTPAAAVVSTTTAPTTTSSAAESTTSNVKATTPDNQSNTSAAPATATPVAADSDPKGDTPGDKAQATPAKEPAVESAVALEFMQKITAAANETESPVEEGTKPATALSKPQEASASAEEKSDKQAHKKPVAAVTGTAKSADQSKTAIVQPVTTTAAESSERKTSPAEASKPVQEVKPTVQQQPETKPSQQINGDVTRSLSDNKQQAATQDRSNITKKSQSPAAVSPTPAAQAKQQPPSGTSNGTISNVSAAPEQPKQTTPVPAETNEDDASIDEPNVAPQEELPENPSMSTEEITQNEIEKYRINGKMVYSRIDLMNFQQVPLSMKKPLTDEVAAKCGIVYDKPKITRSEPLSSAGAGNPVDMFYPFADNYNRLGMARPVGRPSGPGRGDSRSGRPAYDGRPSQNRVIISSNKEPVKLHTTENAWKPEIVGKKQGDADEEEAKTLDLLKRFRGLLNKITPQKYEVLLKQIDELPIDTEERLTNILDLIFDKAVDEPIFCVQYANLCKHLSTRSITKTNETGATEQVKFQRVLLSRCQKEFESDMYQNIPLDERQAAIDACDNADKKKELTVALEEEKRQARKKSLGNIKLIGELYRVDLLKGIIMLHCITKLMTEKEDESLECLCTLLRTIGHKLEGDAKSKQVSEHLEINFKRLKEMVSKKQTGSRVRFLIQDIIEMRENNWQARQIQVVNTPKTIDQIRDEERKKEEQQRINAAEYRNSSKSKKQSRDESGSSTPNYHGRPSGNRERPINPQTYTDTFSKLRGASSATLGPQTGGFGFWGKGAGLNSSSSRGGAPSSGPPSSSSTSSAPPPAPSTPTGNDDFFKKLCEYSKVEKHSNNDVLEFINKTYNLNEVSPKQASAFFKQVVNSCINSPDNKLDQNLLKKRAWALQTILGRSTQPDVMEETSLNGLSELMYDLQHPQNLFQEILKVLYDSDVYGKEVLQLWRDSASKDKTTRGKAMAVTSAQRFLKNLLDPESGSEADEKE